MLAAKNWHKTDFCWVHKKLLKEKYDQRDSKRNEHFEKRPWTSMKQDFWPSWKERTQSVGGQTLWLLLSLFPSHWLRQTSTCKLFITFSYPNFDLWSNILWIIYLILSLPIVQILKTSRYQHEYRNRFKFRRSTAERTMLASTGGTASFKMVPGLFLFFLDWQKVFKQKLKVNLRKKS